MAELAIRPAEGTGRLARSERLAAARLYLCTDSRADLESYDAFLGATLRGGVDILQLREKGLEAQHELALLRRMAAAARSHDALVVVNDRADLAAVLAADGLHLGQDDLTPAEARAIVGPDLLIGRSTHTVEQGDQAAADPDVDYYCVGPLWVTPTKPGRPAASWNVLAAAVERSVVGGKPWFAIGGINSLSRLEGVVTAGADRVVVVRALTEAGDPERAARDLRAHLPS